MLVYNGDFHFIEKANGIKYLYASAVKHPDVSPNFLVRIDNSKYRTIISVSLAVGGEL